MAENFASRLKLFMDKTEIPSSQFADLCEIPRPSFSQLLSGRNQKISDTLIHKIHAAFPELSVMWLMFGEGNMLSSTSGSGTTHGADAGNTSENAENTAILPNNDTVNSVNSNLNGLTMAESDRQSAILHQFEEHKKMLDLQLQIEKLQKNPRRVTQITVYYDDSTFETFIPSK